MNNIKFISLRICLAFILLCNTSIAFAIEDTSPPLIEEPFFPNQIIYGRELIIRVKIIESGHIKDALLFYKRETDNIYKSTVMKGLEDGYYETTLPGKIIESPGFNYYIQAIDEAGNEAYSGSPGIPFYVFISGRGKISRCAHSIMCTTLSAAAILGGIVLYNELIQKSEDNGNVTFSW